MKEFVVRLFSVCLALLLHAGFIGYLNQYERQQVSSGQVPNSALAVSFSFSSPLIERAEASIPKQVPIEALVDATIHEASKPKTVQPIVQAPLHRHTIEVVDVQRAEPVSDVTETAVIETNAVETDVIETEVAKTNSPTMKDDLEAVDAELNSSEKNEVETESIASEATVMSNQSGVHEDIILDPQFKSDPQPPVYPRLARKRGQEGVVWLDIWLDSRGEQTKLEVYDSSGVGSLDRAAIDAVSQWQFVPKHAAGMTIASRVRIPVHFVLN